MTAPYENPSLTPNPEDLTLEQIDSESVDAQTSLPTYEIMSFPVDYTLQLLVNKYRSHQIQIPPFQRKYVWNHIQASRLMESLLINLPVPPLYLYQKRGTNTLLVVDGHQRLLTLAFFVEGRFGEPPEGSDDDRPVFDLRGLDEKSPFASQTYDTLNVIDDSYVSRVDDIPIRVYIIRQLEPADNTSIYHIFERLNTGGTPLTPQEIRHCLQHGVLSQALLEFNEEAPWRGIVGTPRPHKRMRDVELILRFLALSTYDKDYKKPMKQYLNDFMEANKNPDEAKIKQYHQLFRKTCEAVLNHLGNRPFHLRSGLNAAVFDAVFTVVGRNLEAIPDNLQTRYRRLLDSEAFDSTTRAGTTDEKVVEERHTLVEAFLIK